jgi:uncharacterized protein YecT (DUF1311 family)
MKYMNAILLAAVAFSAQASDHDKDMQITRKFCASATNPLEYDQCSAAELAQAQADLEATSAAAMVKWRDSPETLDALRRAQLLWKASYDADITARFAEIDAAHGHGTAYVSAHNWYEARLTRNRTEQLCEFLRGAAYGERSSEPCEQLVKRILATSQKEN